MAGKKPRTSVLEALEAFDFSAVAAPVPTAPVGGRPIRIALDKLQEDPDNARRSFDHGQLEELAHSIDQHDVLEPLIVVPLGDDRYEIRSGARRFRAARIAARATVPCLIVESLSAARAIVVNLQRENLRPLELGTALCQLADSEELTQADIATLMSRSTAWVSKLMALGSLAGAQRQLLEKLESRDTNFLYLVSRLHAQEPGLVEEAVAGAALQSRADLERLTRRLVQDQGGPSAASPDSNAVGASSADSSSFDALSPSPSSILAHPLPVAGSPGSTPLSKAEAVRLVVEHEGTRWVLCPGIGSRRKNRVVCESLDGSLERVELPLPLMVVSVIRSKSTGSLFQGVRPCRSGSR